MYTPEEMAKLEQEHKDRIANMTREYENSFIERTAAFVLEKKRLGEEIEKQQKELLSIASGIEHNSFVKTDLDKAVESLNKEIKAKTEENLSLLQKSADESAKYSERRAWLDSNLEGMSRKLESIVSEIDLANNTLKNLDGELAAKQEEVKAKGSEAAGYLAELAAIVKEAGAKKDALLAELEDLQLRRVTIVDSIQPARTDLDAINARIEAAKVDMANADADLNKQRALYTENITKFKDLDALRSDMQARQIDIKFREDQLARKQKALNDQEQKLKTMAGGV